jgi:hypothetical protein
MLSGFVARSVIPGTVHYALVRKGENYFLCGRYQLLEFYLQVIVTVHTEVYFRSDLQKL